MRRLAGVGVQVRDNEHLNPGMAAEQEEVGRFRSFGT